MVNETRILEVARKLHTVIREERALKAATIIARDNYTELEKQSNEKWDEMMRLEVELRELIAEIPHSQ